MEVGSGNTNQNICVFTVAKKRCMGVNFFFLFAGEQTRKQLTTKLQKKGEDELTIEDVGLHKVLLFLT